MLSFVTGKLRNALRLEPVLAGCERVARIGCALPLVHFAILPFGVFFYVIENFLSGRISVDSVGKSATFAISTPAISGFYWLLVFWAHAAVLGFVAFGLYRSLLGIFPPGGFAGAISRTALAFALTSGAAERFIAMRLMPMTMEGLPFDLTADAAPAFRLSLYGDLGALVRSPYWEIGVHSVTSRYSFLPLGALSVAIALYIGTRIATEIRHATRQR
jgi:hypothetical protein